MSILLATLCLNEMEWLPKLYEQHKNWPGMTNWVFVEAADSVYANINPESVSPNGLSVDMTSDWLQHLTTTDSRVHYEPFGFTSHDNPDQGKCPARNFYMEEADCLEPDFIFVLDADEFYSHEDQARITKIMQDNARHTSFCFPHVHPWRPPSVRHKPLFKYGVSGGFWSIGFVRGWRWSYGSRYLENHNHLSNARGRNLKYRMLDFRRKQDVWDYPHCVHMGFTSSLESRQAKHRYYAARGEGLTDKRGWYVDSRKAFETWVPKSPLPNRARVHIYRGPIPECFQ